MSVYTGKNLEDVLKQAAQNKEVEIDQIEYTVLEENKGNWKEPRRLERSS